MLKDSVMALWGLHTILGRWLLFLEQASLAEEPSGSTEESSAGGGRSGCGN